MPLVPLVDVKWWLVHMSSLCRFPQNISLILVWTQNILESSCGTGEGNDRGLSITWALHLPMQAMHKLESCNGRAIPVHSGVAYVIVEIFPSRMDQRPWEAIHSPVALHTAEYMLGRHRQRPWPFNHLAVGFRNILFIFQTEGSNARGTYPLGR